MKKSKQHKNNFSAKLMLAYTTFVILFTASISKATEKFYIPSNPQAKAPLFVVLHGCLSDAQDMESISRFSEFAEIHGFYVFYPEPKDEKAKGCFEFFTEDSQKPGGGDSFIIVNKVQQYLKDYDIDPNKVFVAGMSAGSSIIPTLINCYPDVFHGAALHSGMGYGLVTNWQESLWVAQTGPMKNKARLDYCNSSNYKGKVFVIHGTKDKVMNPKNFTLVRNDYLPELSSKTERYPATADVYGYKRKYYYRDNAMVGQTLLVNGMAHDWSGGKPRSIFSHYGPDVTPMIIEFFLYN